jgi:hypothetical protein
VRKQTVLQGHQECEFKRSKLKMIQLDKKIHYTLRLAAAMCFIGHGAWGIIGKQIWLNYFAVFGVSHEMGLHMMPWLGTIDILMGISIIFYPTRAILFWLTIWGIVTAMLRPMSGESFAEAIERAGNYGAPLTLLMLSGLNLKGLRGWFVRINTEMVVDEKVIASATACLRIVVFLLLAGHGWLNLIEKKSLLGQYASLGFSNPVLVAHLVGIFEVVGAFSVLIRPIRPVLLVLLVWKMGTELFYPHWEVFEWVERGGSYGTILALWLLLPKLSFKSHKQLIINKS